MKNGQRNLKWNIHYGCIWSRQISKLITRPARHRVHAGKGKGEKCLLINFAYRRNLVESLNMSNSSYGIRITIRHVNNMLNIDYD